jgi:hypothetical protein
MGFTDCFGIHLQRRRTPFRGYIREVTAYERPGTSHAEFSRLRRGDPNYGGELDFPAHIAAMQKPGYKTILFFDPRGDGYSGKGTHWALIKGIDQAATTVKFKYYSYGCIQGDFAVITEEFKKYRYCGFIAVRP